jgi:hypothetical protein
MRHWRNNVNATMHGVQEEATCAANAGFELAVQLFRDIRSGTRSVSEIAFDRLKELVRFCFSYAFETGSSTWPRCRNSIRARTLPYAQLPGQEENWMVKSVAGLRPVLPPPAPYKCAFTLAQDLSRRVALRLWSLPRVRDRCFRPSYRESEHSILVASRRRPSPRVLGLHGLEYRGSGHN